jgi:putative ABC transport system ATP-binding protein
MVYSKTAIRLEHVSKTYKMDAVEVKALRDVTLSIKEREFLSVMGASGSGKSTLLHIMGCLDKPSSGRVFLHDIDTSTMGESRLADIRGEKIGFVFQFFYLFPTLSAIENIQLPMTILGKDEAMRERRAEELIRLVGLEDRAGHLPSQLSGGERQRIAIARSLANDPTVILADEPTGNVDAKTGHELMELFLRLNKKSGKTVVVITHDRDIASHAQRIVEICDGTIRRS